MGADECAIGRAALGWSADDLARAAGVDVAVVEALEASSPAGDGASKIEAALAAAGVTFRRVDGRSMMIARTLDGIIEAPVKIADRGGPRDQASVVKR